MCTRRWLGRRGQYGLSIFQRELQVIYVCMRCHLPHSEEKLTLGNRLVAVLQLCERLRQPTKISDISSLSNLLPVILKRACGT